MSRQDYIFDNTEARAEYDRLRLIEQVYDPATQRHLTRLGLKKGSLCLEVGPGAGSILEWMADQAGLEGAVDAIDKNLRFASLIRRPNITFKEADITRVSLPEGRYDLIHARYVFIHVPEARAALAKLVRALKPGGWMLIEDPDFSPAQAFTSDPNLANSFSNVREAIRRMYEGMNLDWRFGNKLRDLLKEAGLIELGEEVAAEKSPGGSIQADMMKRSALHLREVYMKTGAVSKSDIDNYARLASEPAHSAIYYASVSAWGQKP